MCIRDRTTGVTFQRGSDLDLVVYADAAYAPKETKKKYVSGGAVMCGGAAIQWISRTQKCSTLSSSEAEYAAMAEGFNEALFLRSVWRFHLPDFGDPFILVLRSTTVRFSWRSTRSPTRTRSTSTHATISCENGEFEISHVQSKCQHADFLTKPPVKDAFRFHRNFKMNMSRYLIGGALEILVFHDVILS